MEFYHHSSVLLPILILFPYTTLFRSDGDDGPEGLLTEAGGVLRDVGQQGGLVEQRPQVRAGAATGQHPGALGHGVVDRSEEHTSELQSRFELVCRFHLKKNNY